MSGVRTSGVYQPRKRGAALAESFANARRQVARLLKIALNRGAGLLVLVAAAAVLVALMSYNPNDPSPNTATAREATNLLGPFGATERLNCVVPKKRCANTSSHRTISGRA